MDRKALRRRLAQRPNAVRFEELERYLKDQARAEAITNITATLGEFMGEDSDDSANWDAKNMASWMMSRFQVNLSQAQIRRTSADSFNDGADCRQEKRRQFLDNDRVR